MKKIFTSTLLLAMFSFCLIAQDSYRPADLVAHAKSSIAAQNPTLFENVDSRNIDVPSEITEYDVFTLQKSGIDKVLSIDAPFLEVSLPTTSRSSMELELVQVDIFGGDGYVTTMPAQETMKVNHGKHYRGIVKGDPNSMVAISVFENEIMGLVANDEGNLVIGKMDNEDYHILYKDSNLKDKLGFACDTPESDIEYTENELFVKGDDDSRALSDCVRIYLEVDYDIYQDKGSSVSQTTDFITGLFNQVAIMYANENINVVLSPLTIWTQPSPYNSSSSSGMLNAFLANTGAFDGDLAQLLSYKASGGIAYVDQLCSSNPDYSKSFSSINPTYSNVPTYSWSVMVMTHEFGHLFGSSHTHACAWNGNNTAIDGCYTTEGSCADPGIPTGGGTVMSYCHLTSAGINLNLGFGPQPGNLIRNRVENASCTQACDDGGGGGGGDPTCTDTEAVLTILTDNYPGETTWTLKDASGNTLYSGGPYSSQGTSYSETFCLVDGCYDFQINDSYGDGICCGYGQGNYSITVAGQSVASGGAFGSVEITNFCVGDSNAPTCTDGVQNGNETGVDCGGPDCAPCFTCSDGVQNGNETGVDCGGPDCDACPTCDDGIQNGSETGVDCGGPDCAPCGGSGGGGDIILAHYFESGWDGWSDGGSDCYRYSGSRSWEGNYSIRIRDNSGTASSMTSPSYDLSAYSGVEVNFYFYPNSMENGEDFWLRYYNGSSWSTVAAFVSGTNFNNNTFYVATVPILSGMSSNSRFRFQCDASANADRVYIDAVTVTTLSSGSLPSNEVKITALQSLANIDGFSTIEEMNISPNPASDIITIDMELDYSQSLDVVVSDVMGRRVVMSTEQGIEGNHSFQMDISSLESGAYIIAVTDAEGDRITKKFLKLR